MPRLVHPETGQEFDALDRAVPTWQRSGWTLKNPPPAPAEAAKNGKAAAGTTAEVPKAGE